MTTTTPCALCTANTVLYGQADPCQHSQAVSTPDVPTPAATAALAATLLARPALPELRVQQTAPTTDKPGVRCFTCARLVPVGETYTRIEVDRWGSPKRGVLVTLAICRRCVTGPKGGEAKARTKASSKQDPSDLSPIT